MKEILIFICGIILVCLFVYGMGWVAKHLSYWWWYEDLVKETIRQMVQPEYLKLLK